MTEQSATGRRVFAALQLLDRQLIAADSMLAGKVDDLELEPLGADDNLYVTAILSGLGALGPRIGGRLGRWFAGLHRRLHPDPDAGPARIPFDVVKRVNNHVEVTLRRDELPNFEFERWVREHMIDHIPGADRAPE